MSPHRVSITRAGHRYRRPAPGPCWSLPRWPAALLLAACLFLAQTLRGQVELAGLSAVGCLHLLAVPPPAAPPPRRPAGRAGGTP